MYSFFPSGGLGSNSVQVTSENEFGGLEAKHICPYATKPRSNLAPICSIDCFAPESGPELAGMLQVSSAMCP